MFDSVVDVLGRLRPVVGGLDVKALDAEVAAELVELFVEIEQLAVAGRVVATRVVAGGDRWRREGFRSAGAWMAAKAGVPVGPALRTMAMAELLDGLPLVAAAFRAGRLSEGQAGEIADAAAEVPAAQQPLLDAAGKVSFGDLREECRRVKASVLTAEEEEGRHRRIHRGRYLRSWMDRDGAVRLDARLAADEGARLLAAVEARQVDIMEDALRGRWFENADAHRADALVDLARTAGGADPGGPEVTVHVVVDYDALMRGHTVEGERCEIPGLGPIPVSVARGMAEDCILKVLVTKGVEITAVAHAGRRIPAHLRSALEVRDPTCVVPHCQMRRGLHIDHRAPWSPTRDTSLANLARLCRWHHYQKSHLGYTYRGGPGTWQWVPPHQPIGPPIYPP